MSDWYYENKGERGGPVSADEIRQLYAGGIISLASLVWTAAFGTNWKRLSETELAPPAHAGPPPLPPPPLPTAAPAPQPAAVIGDAFLDSDLTRVLIGRKHEHYLASWRSLLAKASGDPEKVAQVSSWNWPALVFPYGWLLYRKMYVLGAVVLAFQLAYVLLPDTVSSSISRAMGFGVLGFGIMFALYGNAWYLGVVHRRWKELAKNPDQAAVLDQARRTGGVNPILPAVALGLVLAAAILPYLLSLLGDDAERLVRKGYMSGYAQTSIGKAFAANFDDARWKSFTNDKGATVVEFNGKINASLHANAVERLMRPAREARYSTDAEARLGEYEHLAPHFEGALAHLKASNRLQPLWDKHNCKQAQGQPASCSDVTALLAFARDAVEAWADEAYWRVGAPVSVQWTINADGRSFSLASMSSEAWSGLPFQDIFEVLYD